MSTDVAATQDALRRLTPKERECLRLVAAHFSSRQIAGELGISKTSVDTYCDRAREKLGVPGRREAARLLAAAPGEAPASAAPASLAPARAPARVPTLGARGRLLLLALAAVMAPVALATLLAGLRALREVAPDPYAPAIVQAERPTGPS
jgi:DNA-binding CsgD family transcriptional regulator